MIIVRNCFVTKPGCASKLAGMLKEAGSVAGIPNFRILTDMTGEFNRVVLEFEVANLGEVEAQMKNYQTNEAFRAKMVGYTDLWITGSRELMQVA